MYTGNADVRPSGQDSSVGSAAARPDGSLTHDGDAGVRPYFEVPAGVMPDLRLGERDDDAGKIVTGTGTSASQQSSIRMGTAGTYA